MKLLDIYEQLTYGELSQQQLGVGSLDDGVDDTPKTSYKRLYPLVKLGLTELHKRFKLREAEFNVNLTEGKVIYLLALDYAKSYTKSKVAIDDRYIDDSATAFADDLMQVERIYGVYRSAPYEIPLNNLDNPAAIRTTSYNTLVIPDDVTTAPWLKETSVLRLVYRADHPAITNPAVHITPDRIPIYLPVAYLQALVYYVASRVMTAKGNVAEFHDGNNYAMKFEAEVAELRQQDFTVSNVSEYDKLSARGFV
jgi:hypothetical protein